MVIKTDLCVFTEYRIYPGRGQRFIAKDGKVQFYITKKAAKVAGNRPFQGRRGSVSQKVKPVKLRWTQAWRRMNKKGKTDEGGKKRTRKAQKFQKAIVGMSLEDIKKKKAQKPELRQAAKEAAAKEAKARQSTKKGSAPAKGAASGSKAGGAKPKAGGKLSKAQASGAGGAQKAQAKQKR